MWKERLAMNDALITKFPLENETRALAQSLGFNSVEENYR